MIMPDISDGLTLRSRWKSLAKRYEILKRLCQILCSNSFTFAGGSHALLSCTRKHFRVSVIIALSFPLRPVRRLELRLCPRFMFFTPRKILLPAKLFPVICPPESRELPRIGSNLIIIGHSTQILPWIILVLRILAGDDRNSGLPK